MTDAQPLRKTGNRLLIVGGLFVVLVLLNFGLDLFNRDEMLITNLVVSGAVIPLTLSGIQSTRTATNASDGSGRRALLVGNVLGLVIALGIIGLYYSIMSTPLHIDLGFTL